MNRPAFVSVFAEHIRTLLAVRQALGHGDVETRKYLRRFDAYVAGRGWTEPRLTSELIDGWLASLGNIQPGTRAARLRGVRHLSLVVAETHPGSYVPPTEASPRSAHTFRPYAYRPADVHALLAAARALKPWNGSPAAGLRARTYATILGLVYCTGLRISEALALRIGDVDLKEDCLIVIETKFHKSRAVPFLPDVGDALRAYRRDRDAAGFSTHQDASFFVNRRGERYACATVQAMFGRILIGAGVRGGARRPRIHDLRHAYAVNRLLDWYRDGGDVQARLPRLATYMGHVCLISTQTYLHATAELLQVAGARFHPPSLEAGGLQGVSCG